MARIAKKQLNTSDFHHAVQAKIKNFLLLPINFILKQTKEFRKKLNCHF